MVGRTGGPQDGAGFALSVDGSNNLVIGAGTYYVEGVPLVNEADVTYQNQPHPTGEPVPTAAGDYLAFLDAWDRHITALDDDYLREKGLGGPDTANRVQTIWQVRLLPMPVDGGNGNGGADPICDGDLVGVMPGLAPSGGLLAAQTTLVAPGDDPCGFEERAGYRLLENHLYRVEIHDPGDAGAATYKWSPDNGALAFAVESVEFDGSTSNRVKVRILRRDQVIALKVGDFVEIVDDADVLAGEPGLMLRVTAVDVSQRVLTVEDPANPGGEPIPATLDIASALVRKWAADVGTVPAAGVTVELEGGVEVSFSGAAFHTGDYWQIAARVNTGTVEWPDDGGGNPLPLPPFGIEHRYAQLAAVTLNGGAPVIVDRRDLFPAVTALTSLFYVGGDGQEPELPGGAVPHPLQVGVANGTAPIDGVRVQFRVVSGTSTITHDGDTDVELVVPTDDGVAAVTWDVDPTEFDHVVEARLWDRCDDPAHLPIRFSSHVNYKLHYLSGDGQSERPGEPLRPLRVWVSRGRFPVQGARVRFDVTHGNGTVDDEAAPGAPSVPGGQKTWTTDANGVAEVRWALDATSVHQRVTATLRHPTDAAALHEASIAFNANLNVATEVAYDPSCDAFGTIDNVAEALDFLCSRDTGQDCTFSITPGNLAEQFAAIQDAAVQHATICFEKGEYSIPGPLVLTGKGHLVVSGAGFGSHLIATSSGTFLRFEDCESVTVRDIQVEARKPRSGGDEEGLGGALTFENCPVVAVEKSLIRIGSWAERAGAGVTVRMTRPGTARTWDPVRIEDCQFEVGNEQVGVLLVDVERSHVENNVIRSSKLPATLPLERMMDSLRFRAAARDLLVRDLSIGVAGATAITVAAQGTLTITAQPADGETITIDAKTYALQTTLTDVDGNIQIGADRAATQANIAAAINLTGVAGTDYAASMSIHPTVEAGTWVADDLVLTARTAGAAGNTIVTTESMGGTNNAFDAATLGTTRGGVDAGGGRGGDGIGGIGGGIGMGALLDSIEAGSDFRLASRGGVIGTRDALALRALGPEATHGLMAVVAAADVGSGGAGPAPDPAQSGLVTVPAGTEAVTFTTFANLVPAWDQLIALRATDVPNGDRAVEVVLELADEVLMSGGVSGGGAFVNWFAELRRRYRSTGAQGIVVAGTLARDVRVLNNTVSGMAQGIHIGLSDSGGRPESAQVVQVHGNTVVGHENVIRQRRPEGVFAGNANSVVVGTNLVSFNSTADEPRSFAGILLDGRYGPRVLVHENQIEATSIGVRVVPQGSVPSVRRWLVRDNVASPGAVVVDAPPSVSKQGNSP